MDKPTTPAGRDGSLSPWPEDSGSETSFGATGAFGILKQPEEAEKPEPSPAIDLQKEKSKPPSSKTGQLPTFGGKPLEEPVVHKVVFGGGDDRSAELLDRIRMASAERPIFKEKTPATPQAGGQGSSGFTQLLRSLGGESPGCAPSAKPAMSPETHKPAPISGFTSLLQTLNAPDPKAVAAAPSVKPAQAAVPPVAPEPPKAPAPPVSAPVAQAPVSFTEYLRATAAGNPAPSNPQARSQAPAQPAAAPLAAPSNSPGTFTQLFGALGGAEASAPPPTRSSPPAPAPSQPGSFTQLFGTFESPEASAAVPLSPSAPHPGQGEIPLPAATPPQPAPNTPGSFTQLFGTFGSAETGVPVSGTGGLPMGAAAPPVAENKPGEFTKLFGTFGSAETASAAPAQLDREPTYPSAGAMPAAGSSSFTRMLSLEQMSLPEPAYREERAPLPGAVDYGLTPGTAGTGTTGAETSGSAAQTRDPFAQPMHDLEPVAPVTPASSGVGITQLIRMLDQPATPSAPLPVAPASPVSGGPGIWTQTFASLSESPGPAATPPSWTPSATPSIVSTAVNPPAAAGTPAGPSEFTRILDASRLRELAMKGGQGEGAAGAAQGQSGAAAKTVPMPSFTAPPLPSPTPMPAMKGMPQPGAFAPPPLPAIAPPPAVKPPAPAAPAAGKLQQFVPLLLVLVIVLLVVLLVTVIFLMKH